MNYIISSLFTTCLDPQRQLVWQPEPGTINDWYSSGKKICELDKNIKLLVFHDQLNLDIIKLYDPEYITFIKVEDCDKYSPHDYRWLVYQNFIQNNFESIDNVFFTDIQDVLIKQNPFKFIDPSILYIGDEFFHAWENEWAYPRKDYYIRNIPKFIKTYELNKYNTFLNAGICGGNKFIISKFLDKICYYIGITLDKPYITTDMILFNYIVYEYFPSHVHGEPVNSKFKQYENDRNDIWFVHK